jgi:hypothetical protein
MTRSAGASGLGLAEAARAYEQKRAAAAAAPSMATLDALLANAGVDPWRRYAIRSEISEPAQAADVLSYAETWRLGGAAGLLSPHPSIDGGAHFGAVSAIPFMMEGRRSAGLIGACAVDAQIRVAVFLQSEHLPDLVFGDVAAGVIAELFQNTVGARPDDFNAYAFAVRQLDDARLEEHLLALVADGTLARPDGTP